MTDRLRIGFIPLCDAVALLVAVDKGFAAAEGLEIELVREVSWSNVRDKLNIGHFDAAHLIAPIAIASSLGLGHIKVPIIAPFALGVNGNAITVSPALHAAIVEAAQGGILDPMVFGSRACGRGGAAQGEGRRAAHLRHDVPVSTHDYRSAFLDGGRRRRSGRGRAARGAAAALHGGEPAEPAGRRLLRRRAMEFGRGRFSASATSCISIPRSSRAPPRNISACASAGPRRTPISCSGSSAARIGARRTSPRTRAIATRSRPCSPRRIASGWTREVIRRTLAGRAEGFAARRLPLRSALSPGRARRRRAPRPGASGLALRPDGPLGAGAALARDAGSRQGGVPARSL